MKASKIFGRIKRDSSIFVIGLTVFLLGGAPSVRAQVSSHAGHGMGTVDFRVSCTPEAQTKFNEAVALLHHMTYPQARQAFEQVAALDARCAMAHWGIAVTLFQPLWPTRPGPKELNRGWQSVV